MGKIVLSSEYDYFERKKLISSLCDRYKFVRKSVIGKSCSGKDITAIKIGAASEYGLITAAFHGSERITSTVLLMFIEDLCEAIKSNGYIAGINAQRALRGRGIIFIPCVNPDGCDISLLGTKGCGNKSAYIAKLCKNDFTHNDIAEQLKVHSIRRVYHAIVHGVIKEDEGTVDAPIGRHPIDRKKMSINHKNGKEAVTHFKVIKRFKNFTYIQCQLETGRTHQIRVHMASLHHPLLGDEVYGPAKSPFKLQGQTLHAKIIGIVHPRTREYVEADAPLPEYFEALLAKLELMN